MLLFCKDILFIGEQCYKIVYGGKQVENRMMKFAKLGALIIVGILVVSSTTVMATFPLKAPFSAITKTLALSDSSKGETEIKYYIEENLDQVIGVMCHPCIWKSGIRLTQDEMGTYTDWTMTKVNVAFSADNGCPSMDVKIYIYDKGTTPTNPGAVIVSDTTATLDTTGIITIPLETPVNLSGHEELWVAVEWYYMGPGPGGYYAWMDTLSGPHVTNKSDFVYLNDYWGTLHEELPEVDGRWGIGAIIEGTNLAELSIGNLKGPMGIKADVSNVGESDANNVQWSIAVSGGLLKRVNATTTGTIATLAAGASTPVSVGTFIGFGKISIVITAKALNAGEESVTKIAFMLGPFIVGIR